MDYPTDTEYCHPETETSDVNIDPSATTQLEITEHPADASETHDEHDRQHLEYDSFEASVAKTDIDTLTHDSKKWTRLRQIHAGMDKRPGRDDNEQKVDLQRLDKKRTAEAVASQFGLRGRQKTVMVAWVVNSDLRGYSRHHGGRLGAACAEACFQLFNTEYEALDSEWVIDKITDITGGTRVVTEVSEDGDVENEYLEEEEPVEPRGLLGYHWDRRRQV